MSSLWWSRVKYQPSQEIHSNQVQVSCNKLTFIRHLLWHLHWTTDLERAIATYSATFILKVLSLTSIKTGVDGNWKPEESSQNKFPGAQIFSPERVAKSLQQSYPTQLGGKGWGKKTPNHGPHANYPCSYSDLPQLASLVRDYTQHNQNHITSSVLTGSLRRHQPVLLVAHRASEPWREITWTLPPFS